MEEGECDANHPCENSNAICDLPDYNNCEWCDVDAKECKPGTVLLLDKYLSSITCLGCETDQNCPDEAATCSMHNCISVGNSCVCLSKVTNKVVKEDCARMKPGRSDVTGGFTRDVLLHGPDSLFECLAAVQILSCTWRCDPGAAQLCFYPFIQRWTKESCSE